MCSHSPDPTRPSLQLALPDWVWDGLPSDDHVYATLEERMALVVGLAGENVRRGTGGPFAAAVFERASGRLIAPGVNLVLSVHWSGAHAEIVACALAQQALGAHDLGADGLPTCELVTSVEPCAMCLGSIPWSGVCSVVYGAHDTDARAIGFDEGHKPAKWQQLLRKDGIEVTGGVLRAEATAVLRNYAEGGGAIYNGRSSGAGSAS